MPKLLYAAPISNSMLFNSDQVPSVALAKCTQALGLPRIQRHAFICADQTIPKCCDKALGLESWNYLKQRLTELKLAPSLANHPISIFRTKANCLCVCQRGPIMVVYPDGVWYHSVTPEVIEQIIQSHFLNNRILEAYAFLVHPLSDPSGMNDWAPSNAAAKAVLEGETPPSLPPKPDQTRT